MARELPRRVDTVVVGNGPSALILSYILHGHLPVYDLDNPHPDAILHEKLKKTPNLLDLDVDYLTEHFLASRFSYSTQALPINVLLDTLVRPLGETDEVSRKTCVKWTFDKSSAVSHVVVGDTPVAGGQWVDNPVKASWDIGSLSYAGMLSLPEYSFEDFYLDTNGCPAPAYLRPTRRDIAKYFAKYPAKVGIADTLYCGEKISGVTRTRKGFYIASHRIDCQHLVLASGIFNQLIPPRKLLQPLLSLSTHAQVPSPDPILVVGSGFSAADIIVSTPPSQKIVHIYKWSPSKSPSPLRACHQQAYPEYAGVYQKMKLAALASYRNKEKRPSMRRLSSSTLASMRDWNTSYEGLPNTAIIDVRVDSGGGVVTLQSANEPPYERKISSIAYVVGRRGSLAYLDHDLQTEVCPGVTDASLIPPQALREKANQDLEVAKDVHIIGSLTGDSLIRFAYGGCSHAAGRIMREALHQDGLLDTASSVTTPMKQHSEKASPFIPAMNGFDGHDVKGLILDSEPLDRRKA